MSRRLRFIPAGSVVEITSRTVQGRFLLQPSPQVADLCRGVLARAARLHPVQVHGFVFLGNHYHLLVTAASAQLLARFMCYLNSNLAREIGRAVGWREKFWGRRYQAILVSGEEAAQVERLLYLLRQGCKENLVRRPEEWPGATAVSSLLTGAPVVGRWFDRTAQYRASRRVLPECPADLVSRESLELAPLPCWRHFAPHVYRQRISELVGQVERESERRLLETGKEPLGRSRLRLRPPHEAAARKRRSPAPLVHAASQAIRNALREAYREFAAAFRRASQQFRRGRSLTELLGLFPEGSFPPPGPFVTASGAA